MFAIGKTTVTCSATDNSNNLAQTTFVVKVLGLPFGGGVHVDVPVRERQLRGRRLLQHDGDDLRPVQRVQPAGHPSAACAPTSGGSCSDGNACTADDVCSAGVCVSGPPLVCDDHNLCTADSCNPASGCVFPPGNAGLVCRPAASACDTAERCTGTSAVCGPSTDQLPPALSAGANQVVVGTCSTAPLVLTAPRWPTGFARPVRR